MKGRKYYPILLGLLFLTGCWDQTPLRDASLALSSSVDLQKDGKILYAASFPRTSLGGKGDIQQHNVEIVSASANTPREAQMKIDTKLLGTFDSSKLRVVLIGEELAKQNLFSLSDVLFRNPKSSLSARPAVVEGIAADVVKLKLIGGNEISQYLLNLMKSLESLSVVNNENIESLASKMLDPGQDFLIPYLKMDENKSRPAIIGLAMFDEDKYTGKYLTMEQSIMYHLLENKKGEYARFTRKVDRSATPLMNKYITINVKKMKRKLKVEVKKSGVINAHIHLILKVDIIEYPQNRLGSQKEIQKLNTILSKDFTKQAETVAKLIQEANCDGLGIGRRLNAFYPNSWKKLNWQKDYQKVHITPTVKVEIIGHGITD